MRPAKLTRSGFGVIVAWNDTRLSRPGVYAQRIDLDPLTAGIDDPPVANATLALEAPRPNPSRQGVTLALALPDERPARLDVLDLAGRRIATRDLAGLGPGRHVIALPEIERLGAGLYLVQLQQRAGIRQTKLLRLR